MQDVVIQYLSQREELTLAQYDFLLFPPPPLFSADLDNGP